ncbi:putative membrane protein YfcA [Actinopolyspora lacussalsi]|nr:putative membrane protein YfcA [Actinopolyspora lacussalsi]
MIAALAFGVVIGLAMGLLGAGGSILAVPALVYGVGLPLRIAIPASLLIVAISAIGGLLPRARREKVLWPVALVFGAAGVPAAFGGAALGGLLPDRWLLVSFAVLMVVVAVRMLTGGEAAGGSCRTDTGGVEWRSCLPKSLLSGAGVGVLTGLFGVGGGFVVVPALTLLLGLAAQRAVATSLLVVLINSVAGLAAHSGVIDEIEYPVVLAFAITALLVSALAARLTARLRAETIRHWFGYVVLVIAIGVGVAALTNPAALGG